jgi:hypothetical protein
MTEKPKKTAIIWMHGRPCIVRHNQVREGKSGAYVCRAADLKRK